MMTVFEVIVVVAFAPKNDGAATVLLVSVEPKYLPQQTVPIALNEMGERPVFVLPLRVMVPFEVVAIHIAAATGVASHDFFEPLQPGGIGETVAFILACLLGTASIFIVLHIGN